MKKSGFSLLELLIVIIIIGVLAVVAYTQYKNMTEKSRYTEAYTVLTNIRAAQFKYYERNNGWATSFVNLPTDRVLIGTTATPADLINLFYFANIFALEFPIKVLYFDYFYVALFHLNCEIDVYYRNLALLLLVLLFLYELDVDLHIVGC